LLDWSPRLHLEGLADSNADPLAADKENGLEVCLQDAGVGKRGAHSELDGQLPPFKQEASYKHWLN